MYNKSQFLERWNTLTKEEKDRFQYIFEAIMLDVNPRCGKPLEECNEGLMHIHTDVPEKYIPGDLSQVNKKVNF